MSSGLDIIAHSPSSDTLRELSREVVRARIKHPGEHADFPSDSFLGDIISLGAYANRICEGCYKRESDLLAALLEEVGEFAAAITDGESVERKRAEIIQVACVAVRIYEALGREATA